MPREKSTNPLAKARGQQKSPANVWFRRSGAGYRLFVEYYSHQPLGVVVPIDANHTTEKESEKECSLKRPATAAGMSRAAKRRRKRIGGGNNDKEPVDKDISTTDSIPTRTMVDTTNSPLLQASTKNAPAHLHPFFQAMSRPLPTTFRIRQSILDSHRTELLQQLEKFKDIVTPTKIQSQSSTTIFQSILPKYQLPNHFKEFLVHYSQNGAIARQELGSMLPVMAISLSPGDCVVDMCASPGSKTLQAIEVVVDKHQQGVVLANDVLESRLDALREAVTRSGIPESFSSSIHYSHVDATKLSLSAPCQAVLCDVPCSGDGTCRKDGHILPMWKPQAGNTLHSTQLAILKRSVELVQVGGVVCYSTCSLNPVEDEAVVAAALTTFGESVELIEVSSGFDGWIHRPGVSTWKVAQFQDDGDCRKDNHTLEQEEKDDEDVPTLTWYETYEEAKDEMMEAVPTMWPCKQIQHLSLERCARLLPQDYDSGGFFLALLKKCKDI